eukprot:3220707-Rhodomonas_salina.1
MAMWNFGREYRAIRKSLKAGELSEFVDALYQPPPPNQTRPNQTKPTPPPNSCATLPKSLRTIWEGVRGREEGGVFCSGFCREGRKVEGREEK